MESRNSSVIFEFDSRDTIALFEFIVQGIGITALATFGIIGNILSAFILTRPKLKTSITWFLLGLTFFDGLFLTLNILIYSLISVFNYLDIAKNYRKIMDPVAAPYLVYINDTVQTASVYFTVAIAIERFFVIRWPILSRAYCTYESGRLYSMFVIIAAIVVQIRRFIAPPVKVTTVDYSVLTRDCPHLLPTVNDTLTDELDEDYEQYFFQWPYLTFMVLLPYTTLVIFNTLIWIALRKGTKRRYTMTSKLISREEKERSITIMLFVVVIVFIICQSVFFIMVLLAFYFQCIWEQLKFYLISMDLLLITTNSSVNFLIYCVFGSKFREQVRLSLKKHVGEFSVKAEILERTTSTKKSSSVKMKCTSL